MRYSRACCVKRVVASKRHNTAISYTAFTDHWLMIIQMNMLHLQCCRLIIPLHPKKYVHGLLKKVVRCFWYGFTDSCLPSEHIIASQCTSCLKPALWFGCLLLEESVLLFLGLCWGQAVSQQFLSFPCCVYVFSWIAEQQAVWLVTLPPVRDSSSVPSGRVADMICRCWAPELLYFQPVWWETGLTGSLHPGSAPMGANKFLLLNLT